jgi:flagellar protein FliS
MNAYMHQYQQTQVTTASPEKILIMLYDGAIRLLGQARHGMEAGEPLKKRESISKAIAIIAYLSDTLDHEAGWEGSIELDGLYGFMVRELTRANLTDNLEAIVVVEGLLEGLRTSWAEAIQMIREQKAQATAGEAPAMAPPGVAKPAEYRPLAVSL